MIYAKNRSQKSLRSSLAIAAIATLSTLAASQPSTAQTHFRIDTAGISASDGHVMPISPEGSVPACEEVEFSCSGIMRVLIDASFQGRDHEYFSYGASKYGVWLTSDPDHQTPADDPNQLGDIWSCLTAEPPAGAGMPKCSVGFAYQLCGKPGDVYIAKRGSCELAPGDYRLGVCTRQWETANPNQVVEKLVVNVQMSGITE